jgi:hypothetical protein
MKRSLSYLLGLALAALVWLPPAMGQEKAGPPAVQPPAKDAATEPKGLELPPAEKSPANRVPDRPDVRNPKPDSTPERPDTTRDADAPGQDPTRNPRRDTREDNRDAREGTRDARQNSRDARDDVRDARRDFRADGEFRAETARAADLGIWFGSSAGADGLVIADIAAQGAIAKIGFQEGDRIVSINGQRVASETEFVRYLLADDIRTQRVKVVVFRDGREVPLFIQPSILVQEVVTYDPLWHYGLVIDDRYPGWFVVERVYPRTPAYYWGLRRGDVIVSLGGRRIASMDDLATAFRSGEGRLALQVNRGNRTRDINIDTSIDARTSLRPNFDADTRLDGRSEGRVPGRDPADRRPDLDRPGADRPATDRPGTDRPSADRPSTDPPSTDRPGADRPSADRPGADRPGSTPGGKATPATPARPGTPATPARPGAAPASPATPATPAVPAAPSAPAPAAPSAPR